MSIDDLPPDAALDDCVVIIGGGPVGLTLALTLSRHGVSSKVIEKSPVPTKQVSLKYRVPYSMVLTARRFPKMDLLLARTMEIYRLLGFADEVRKQGNECL